jgi:hypothetical protein
MKLKTLTLDAPDWESYGTDKKEDGRLYATVIFLGVHHHLEAIPVKETADALDEGATPIAADIIDSLHVAFGSDGPFESVKINGKRYAVFMSPFQA